MTLSRPIGTGPQTDNTSSIQTTLVTEADSTSQSRRIQIAGDIGTGAMIAMLLPALDGDQ